MAAQNWNLLRTYKAWPRWRNFCHSFFAFSVFESFDEDVRKDYAHLKTSLTNAFSLNTCTAYEAFVSRRYVTGESVDVYLSELHRLGRLVSSTTTDSWIKCAFIAGLPENVKSQLKAACSLETMSLALVVERARSLTNAQETCGAVGLGKEKRPIICFNCRQPGHLSSNCTEKRHQCRGGRPYRGTRLFCGDKGHFIAKCPVRIVEASKNQ